MTIIRDPQSSSSEICCCAHINDVAVEANAGGSPLLSSRLHRRHQIAKAGGDVFDDGSCDEEDDMLDFDLKCRIYKGFVITSSSCQQT